MKLTYGRIRFNRRFFDIELGNSKELVGITRILGPSEEDRVFDHLVIADALRMLASALERRIVSQG